jgi:hypothetical protein
MWRIFKGYICIPGSVVSVGEATIQVSFTCVQFTDVLFNYELICGSVTTKWKIH